MSKGNLDSFTQAFSGNVQSMHTFCDCGVEFGSKENAENEVISHWYGIIEFEGKEYVEECGCWYDRARHIANWIDRHKREIAKYLQAEKVRLTKIAEDHPTVDL